MRVMALLERGHRLAGDPIRGGEECGHLHEEYLSFPGRPFGQSST